MKLHLAKDFSLPIDAATQTFAFIGRKGSGKTYGAGKLAEQLLTAGVQVVVIDTVGNWYGLRIDADGKKAGFDIPVLGGLRGDIPLKVDAGAMVADLVCDTGRSVIIDISQFDAITEYKRFATAFGRRLWERKKSEREPSPIHLVIEESQTIIPQSPGPEDKQMLSIFERIVRLGRNYGIGASLITQRPQSVHKEALNQAEPLLAFQIAGAHERKAIKEWITHQGLDAKLLDELPGLAPGTCYFWSPQWLKVLEKIAIDKKQTLDASATPKVGEKRVRRELAPLDLGQFEERMKAAIEEAKQNDPAALKKRIRELEAGVSSALNRGSDKSNAADIERAYNRGFSAACEKAEKTYKPAIEARDREIRNLQRSIDKAAAALQPGAIHVSGKVDLYKLEGLPGKIEYVPPTPRREIRANPQPSDSTMLRTIANGELTGPEQRILNALAWLEGIGNSTPSQTAVAFLAGYTTGGGAWNNPRGSLRTKGLIEYRQGDCLTLTDAGRALAVQPEIPLTSEELKRRVMERLPGPEQKILRVVMNNYPEPIDVGDAAAAAGYQVGGGAFNNPKGRLRSLGLIEYPAPGQMRAADILFLDGR